MKKILLGLVGLVAVLAVVSMFMPSKWNVERSMTMKAHPETIYTYVADLNQWEGWTVWNTKMDPEMKREVSATAMGTGASMKWSGPKMGNGTMTITQADPKTGVHYELTFEGMKPATGVVSFAADPAGTKVTWTNTGDVGMFLPGRWMIGSMEKSMVPDFDKNLENLKTLAEKAQMDKDKAAAEAAAAAAAAAAAPAPAEGGPAMASPAKP